MKKTAALLALLATPAFAAEPALLRERIGNLGLFAGYVVACGLATEDEASAMVAKLSEGLGAPFDAEQAEVLQKARAAAKKVNCDDGPLRDAVRKGWRNYQEAK
ncbi:hypothetical protein ACFQI3_14110 [Hansschlegelia quercus]|uniref:Uncharacterized protein n=1 Tax=Hansschlegelia quercus TaxID=2528245 RepID=A0A4Q9GII3_9HYPH|nr:hypothetical protein [Hansschlegelia quercus]TBN48665.1 hypothetical protein EYR15_13845 [Hansschlegelia quercus]